MKNQIDPSTPFLAFYDLLRIRGIYSDEEKREKLRRGFRRAMALAAVLIGLMLPHTSWAAGLIAQKAENGRLLGGTTHDFGSGTLLEGTDNVRLVDSLDSDALTSSDTIFKGTSSSVEWRITGGELHSDGDVYFLNFGKLHFDGGTLDVPGLVAAAMSDYSSSFKAGDVFADSEITGNPGVSGAILIAETVNASGGMIVGTSGMANDSEITISSGDGTITFKGTTGDASVLKAGTVTFKDGSEVAGGNVDAGDSGTISGNFTQSDGTMTAGTVGAAGDSITQTGGTLTAVDKIQAAVTQNQAAGKTATIHASTIDGAVQQTAGTIDAGSGTATLSVGAGSTLGAGNVTAGTVTVGSGSGALTLAGNELSGKTRIVARFDQCGFAFRFNRRRQHHAERRHDHHGRRRCHAGRRREQYHAFARRFGCRYTHAPVEYFSSG